MDRTEYISKPPVHAAWLLLLDGHHRGKDFRLTRETSLGRDVSQGGIRLDGDEAISGEHARIRYENGVYVLYDLGSLNGTYLNDKQVQKAVLRDNDELRLGHLRLVFKEAKVG